MNIEYVINKIIKDVTNLSLEYNYKMIKKKPK